MLAQKALKFMDDGRVQLRNGLLLLQAC